MFRKIVLSGIAVLLTVLAAMAIGHILVVPPSGETLFFGVILAMCSLGLGAIAKAEINRPIAIRIRPR